MCFTGYPNEKAAPVAIGTVREFLEDKAVADQVLYYTVSKILFVYLF